MQNEINLCFFYKSSLTQTVKIVGLKVFGIVWNKKIYELQEYW